MGRTPSPAHHCADRVCFVNDVAPKGDDSHHQLEDHWCETTCRAINRNRNMNEVRQMGDDAASCPEVEIPAWRWHDAEMEPERLSCRLKSSPAKMPEQLSSIFSTAQARTSLEQPIICTRCFLCYAVTPCSAVRLLTSGVKWSPRRRCLRSQCTAVLGLSPQARRAIWSAVA